MELLRHGVYLLDGKPVPAEGAGLPAPDVARKRPLRIRFYAHMTARRIGKKCELNLTR